MLSWPKPWPQRLSSKPPSLPSEPDAEDIFNEDTKHWAALVADVYLDGLAINRARIRNVMDMNAGLDTMEIVKKLNLVLRSLHWSTSLYQGQFLVGKKGFWRPSE